VKARRLPILLVVVAFLVGAVALDARDIDEPMATVVPFDRFGPTVPEANEPSSTWYCAAGSATATPDGAAEQLLVLTNDATEARSATVSAFGDDGQQGSTELELPPSSRTQFAVSSIVQASWAAALVEASGGGVGVEHVLSGPAGRAAGPCASSVSPTWYLPVGSTELGVQHLLTLFNPFPDAAVVDLLFETDTDTRQPPELQGMVVPARTVRVVDVSNVVTVRRQLATVVQARSGLVVAEQLEIVGDDSELPQGLTLLMGAPTSAPQWYFADGRPLIDGVDVSFVLFNPGAEAVDAEVQLLVDDPNVNGFVEPYALSVRPGQFSVVDLRQDNRLPVELGWSAVVQTGSPDQELVVARLVRSSVDDGSGGRTMSIGSPLAATRWVVGLGGVSGGDAATVAVVNSEAGREARVSVVAVSGGEQQPVDGLREVVLPAGGRVVLDLGASVDPATTSLLVTATGPIVVERTVRFIDDRGWATYPGLLGGGTTSQPQLFVLAVPAITGEVPLPPGGSDTVPPEPPSEPTNDTGVPAETDAADETNDNDEAGGSPDANDGEGADNPTTTTDTTVTTG